MHKKYYLNSNFIIILLYWICLMKFLINICIKKKIYKNKFEQLNCNNKIVIQYIIYILKVYTPYKLSY